MKTRRTISLVMLTALFPMCERARDGAERHEPMQTPALFAVVRQGSLSGCGIDKAGHAWCWGLVSDQQ